MAAGPDARAGDVGADAGRIADRDVPALPSTHRQTTTVVRPSEAARPDPDVSPHRSDPDRAKRVHRLANPWHRQMLRGVIAAAMVAVVGAGLFFGARIVQQVVDDDELPEIGLEPPVIRSTTFEIRSEAPGPVVDGTLTIDTVTGAFDFTGRPSGAQSTAQVVSPDGASAFVRRSGGGWQLAPSNDALVSDVRQVTRFVIDTDSLDAVLTSLMRDGFVDLRNRSEAGNDADRVVRYDVEIDTAEFEAAFPAEFETFRTRIVPDAPVSDDLGVTLRLDERDLLVQMDADAAGWTWQRIGDSLEPFEPANPVDDLLSGSTNG